MTVDTVRERAAAVDRRARRDDLASIAAFSLIILGNAIALLLHASTVERLGDLWAIAAAIYVLTYYWRAREAAPAALGATPSIDFVRHQVLRRQAMQRRFWQVVALFLPAFLLNDAFVSPQPPQRYLMLAVLFVFLIASVEWLNRREARRLAGDLEALLR